MSLAKKTFSLMMIAFWALITNHCALESIANLDVLTCQSEEKDSSHRPADCERDACASVESGQYRSEENRVTVPEETVVRLVSTLLVLLANSAPDPQDSQSISSGFVPPGFSPGWQFTFRTALPPRAPSVAS